MFPQNLARTKQREEDNYHRKRVAVRKQSLEKVAASRRPAAEVWQKATYARRQSSSFLTSSIACVIGIPRGHASVQLYAVRQRQSPFA